MPWFAVDSSTQSFRPELKSVGKTGNYFAWQMRGEGEGATRQNIPWRYGNFNTRTMVAGGMLELRDVASVGSSEIQCRRSMTASANLTPRERHVPCNSKVRAEHIARHIRMVTAIPRVSLCSNVSREGEG